MMKKFKYVLIYAFISLAFIACSKSGDAPTPNPPTPTPPVATEPSLTAANAVLVDIDPGTTNIYAVIGTTQKIDVKILALPTSGVTIDTKLIKVADNTVAFTNNISSSRTSNPITVSGFVPGVLYNLSVVVTSKTTATNTKTIVFKIAAK
jgi:hypothetical protein